MYEEDFVKEEIVSFDVEGRKFKYLPTTAGTENDWLNQYMYISKDGKPVQDFGKLNELKLLRLTAVPYDAKTILGCIGIEKEWKDLNDEQRWKLLRFLSGSMFDKILSAITKIDKGDISVKKN